MLCRPDTSRQALRRVAGADRDPRLDDGGAGIQLGDHEVHRGSRTRVARVEGALVGIESRVFRQQGRVNVQ